MATTEKKSRRSRIGFGSTYSSGPAAAEGDGIGVVFGGRPWRVKPDKAAKTDRPCLWMQAGVVGNKQCNNFYDCTGCKYDVGMQNQVAKGKKISWQAAMRRQPALNRVCRHSLTGRIPKRACAYDYNCGSCDFDQYFEDVMAPFTFMAPSEPVRVRGFAVPADHYFDNGHTWARVESGGFIRIGVDDFAMRLLGQPDRLELPLTGKTLEKGRAGWGLQRNGNLADVCSPVNGVIVDVNHHIRNDPTGMKDSPYGDGWLFTVRTPDVKKAMSSLMIDQDSLSWMQAEVDHVESMVAEVAGPLAADGGYLADDLFGALPEIGWDALSQAVFKSRG